MISRIGMRLEIVVQEIDKIKAALQGKPYMVNMLSNRNAQMEMNLAKLLVEKEVPAVEASAYVVPFEALVYFRVKGVFEDADGKIVIPHKIITKVSREEVLEKFVSPPPSEAVESARKAGLITAEADSGGHTDGRPLKN